MKKMTNIALVMAFLIALSGCGMEVITPEKTTPEVSGTGAEITERTCEIAEYDRCVMQFKLAQKDIETCGKATKKCTDNLEAYQKKATDNQANIERLNAIFKNYTETTPQTEFKFDLCGKMGTFENKGWFAQFRETLDKTPIAFAKAGRNVRSDDFTGGCSSSEGNIAFFMGAETADLTTGVESGSGEEIFEPSDLFEFHLIKYDITKNTVEEALLADGICNEETCPAVFLSREGAHIPMTGTSQSETCNYKYYFANNILVKTDCVAK